MPEAWDRVSMGSAISISRQRVDPSNLGDELLCHYSIPILDRTDQPIIEPASAIGSQKFRVTTDAVLVSLLNPRIPRVWMAQGGPNAVCSTEFAVLAPETGDLSLDFIHVWCRSTGFWEQLQLRAGGTTGSRQRAKAEGLAKIEMPLPPLPEQRRIVDLVRVLDQAFCAVDVEHDHARQQYDVLLADVMDAQLHDYGARSLLAGVGLQNGYPFKPGELRSRGTRVLRIKQLLDASASWDRSPIDLPARFLVRDRDLVFSWSGTLAVERWDRGEVSLNQHLFRVDVDETEIDSHWYEHCLRWLLPWMNERTHGTTMKHITKRKLADAVIPHAPLAVQHDTGLLLSAAKELSERLRYERDALGAVRDGVLEDLLSRTVGVPESYDLLLGRSV